VTSRDVRALLESKGENPEITIRLLLAKRQLAFVSSSDETINLSSATQLMQIPHHARAGVLLETVLKSNDDIMMIPGKVLMRDYAKITQALHALP
jgi:hypothetical protein